MPLPCRLLVLLLLFAGPLPAQSPAGWTLTVGLDGLRFATAAEDTVTPGGAAVSLRPSGRIGGRVGLQRRIGGWGLGVLLGWAAGEVEASNEAVAIRDRTADLSRYRVALALERRVASVGAGTLAVAVSPGLDLWTVEGNTRTRAGAEAWVALRLPVGRVEVEQRLAFGLSGSPIEQADVGEEFDLRALRTLVFGVGVRLPL
jgi:hypothetical protein